MKKFKRPELRVKDILHGLLLKELQFLNKAWVGSVPKEEVSPKMAKKLKDLDLIYLDQHNRWRVKRYNEHNDEVFTHDDGWTLRELMTEREERLMREKIRQE